MQRIVKNIERIFYTILDITEYLKVYNSYKLPFYDNAF